jgi:hypothetical protein
VEVLKAVQTSEVQLIRRDFLIDMSLFYFTEMISHDSRKNSSHQTTMGRTESE